MTLAKSLTSVWQQVLVEAKRSVALDGMTFPVDRTRARRPRTVRFTCAARRLDGIEPESRHGLALGGYPAWAALGLPE